MNRRANWNGMASPSLLRSVTTSPALVMGLWNGQSLYAIHQQQRSSCVPQKSSSASHCLLTCALYMPKFPMAASILVRRIGFMELSAAVVRARRIGTTDQLLSSLQAPVAGAYTRALRKPFSTILATT